MPVRRCWRAGLGGSTAAYGTWGGVGGGVTGTSSSGWRHNPVGASREASSEPT